MSPLRASLAVLGSAAVLSPANAVAAPDDDGFTEGGFLYLAPGILAIPLAEDSVEEAVDPSYQWGFGAGFLLTPANSFYLTLGAGFEHMPANLENDSITTPGVSIDWDIHMLRISPELRVGGGLRRFFGYLLVAPGVALVHTTWNSETLGVRDEGDDTDVGFNLGLRAGAQGLVWRGLMIGGEFGGSLAFMRNDDDAGQVQDVSNDDYQVHTLDFRVLIGWYF